MFRPRLEKIAPFIYANDTAGGRDIRVYLLLQRGAEEPTRSSPEPTLDQLADSSWEHL